MLMVVIGILILVVGLTTCVALCYEGEYIKASTSFLVILVGSFLIYFGVIEEDKQMEIDKQVVREITIMVNNEVIYSGLLKGEMSLPKSYFKRMQNGDKLNVLYNDVMKGDDDG